MGVVLILQIVKNFVRNFERRLDADFRRPVFTDLELERTSHRSKLRVASHREAIIRY